MKNMAISDFRVANSDLPFRSIIFSPVAIILQTFLLYELYTFQMFLLGMSAFVFASETIG